MKREPHVWVVEWLRVGEWVPATGSYWYVRGDARKDMRTAKDILPGKYCIAKYVRQPQ